MKRLIVEQIKSEVMDNFSYLIGDEVSQEAAVIDPSFSAEKLIQVTESRELHVKYVITTHSHRDHAFGNEEVASHFGAKIVAHRSAVIHKDIPVEDGDVLSIGRVKIQVIYTPGHSYDSICLLVDGKIFTGDTLFVGECGHTKSGSSEDLYYSLFKKLMKLNDDIEMYPGHDYGPRPYSTIGLERKTNYVLKERTLSEFIDFMKT